MDEELNGVEHAIALKDGGPWGFRLSGGAEFGCPLQVAKIRVNSKSYYSGLEEGDILVGVDAADVSLSTHANATQAIEQGGDNVTITVLRGVKSLDNLYNTFLRRREERQAILAKESSISKVNRESGSGPTYHVFRRSAPRDGLSTRSSTHVTVTQPNSQVEYKTFSSSPDVREEAEKQYKLPFTRPPVSPKPQYKTAPSPQPSPQPSNNASTTTSALYLSVGGHGQNVTGQRAQSVDGLDGVSSLPPPSPSFPLGKKGGASKPIIVPIKPFEIPKPKKEVVEFRVRNIYAPKDMWKPANDCEYLNKNDMGEVVDYPPNPNTKVVATDSDNDKRHTKPPANFYWELMENQPEHIPGFNDPLIVDDTQGDFGGNPIVRPEKNIYADSSYYDTKDKQYPTIPEQMRLCKAICQILEAPDAMRSRGGKMYHNRKMKSGDWVKESVGKRIERPYDIGISEYFDEYGCHHWASTMKETLTEEELERLEHNRVHMSKHDLLPPVVAFDINSALKRSRNHGKGVEIFYRNKEKAEQYVVDENNRQQPEFQNKLDTQVVRYQEDCEKYKSPWNAAWEGNIERAFEKVDPCAARSCRDEPDLRKDENPHILGYNHMDATFGVRYKDVTPVRAPTTSLKKNLSTSTPALNSIKDAIPEPRLARMIAPRENEQATFDTYTYKWCAPSYYGQDLLNASVEERLEKSKYGTAGWYRRPADYLSQGTSGSGTVGSLSDVTLKRPKDYLLPHRYQVSDGTYDSLPDISAASNINLKRPKDYYEPRYESFPSQMASPAHSTHVPSYMGGSACQTRYNGRIGCHVDFHSTEYPRRKSGLEMDVSLDHDDDWLIPC